MGAFRGWQAGSVMWLAGAIAACGGDDPPATGQSPMTVFACPAGEVSSGGACVPAGPQPSAGNMAVAPLPGPTGDGDTPVPTGPVMAPSGDGDDGATTPPGDGGDGDSAVAGDGDMGVAAGDGDTGDGDTTAPAGDGDGGNGSRGCGLASPPADGMQTMDVDGLMREFIVALPDGYDANKPYKLVFGWHGLGGTAASIARRGYYGLQTRSAGSTIFVAAQGLDTSNQVGSGPGWDNMGGRDVAFTAAMLGWLRESYCIDNDRIFSVGMSYGGIMSNTVGCALGEDFRAIAPMAGAGPYARSGCKGQVAAWITHGNQDMVVAYSSGQASRDYWLGANGCQMTSMPVGDNGCVAYDGCQDGYPVHWCEFTGGHTVPGFAADEVWAFFSQF